MAGKIARHPDPGGHDGLPVQAGEVIAVALRKCPKMQEDGVEQFTEDFIALKVGCIDAD